MRSCDVRFKSQHVRDEAPGVVVIHRFHCYRLVVACSLALIILPDLFNRTRYLFTSSSRSGHLANTLRQAGAILHIHDDHFLPMPKMKTGLPRRGGAGGSSSPKIIALGTGMLSGSRL